MTSVPTSFTQFKRGFPSFHRSALHAKSRPRIQRARPLEEVRMPLLGLCRVRVSSTSLIVHLAVTPDLAFHTGPQKVRKKTNVV